MDVEADATIARDGSGSAKLHYIVPKMVAALDFLEARERLLPLPTTRENADAQAAGAPGLTISSFNVAETPETMVVDLEISFASPQALCAFIDPSGARASYAAAAALHSLHLAFLNAAVSPSSAGGSAGTGAIDPDLARFIDAAFGAYSVRLTLHLPSQAKSAGSGSVSRDGLDLSWSSPVPALLKSVPPLSWDFSW
jgi:hypothetical protein